MSMNRDLFAANHAIPLGGDPRPGWVLGDFVLEEVLGEGAHGMVFAAVRQTDGRRIALKVLKEKHVQDSQVLTRFMQEAQATARVRHPNIVEVLTVGYEQGMIYYPMEYLVGETLGARIARTKGLSVTEVADIMVPVAMALLAIHEAGLVHRDVKPANIFLGTNPRGGVTPKVLDFGIVKELDPERKVAHTTTGMMLGTPIYMAPEQWKNSSEVNGASDQFSLGSIIHECFTGRKLFSGRTREEVMLRVFHDPIVSLRQMVPSVPEVIETAVQRMLDRDPEKRFESMREVARAFLPFASEGVRADFLPEFEETSPFVLGEKSIHTSRFECAMVSPGRSLPPLVPFKTTVAEWSAAFRRAPSLAPYDPGEDCDNLRHVMAFWGVSFASALIALVSLGRPTVAHSGAIRYPATLQAPSGPPARTRVEPVRTPPRVVVSSVNALEGVALTDASVGRAPDASRGIPPVGPSLEARRQSFHPRTPGPHTGSDLDQPPALKP